METVQEKIAKEIAEAASKDPSMKDKLIEWGKSAGSSAASDVVVS